MNTKSFVWYLVFICISWMKYIECKPIMRVDGSGGCFKQKNKKGLLLVNKDEMQYEAS